MAYHIINSGGGYEKTKHASPGADMRGRKKAKKKKEQAEEAPWTGGYPLNILPAWLLIMIYAKKKITNKESR